jgi:hypothetical protein
MFGLLKPHGARVSLARRAFMLAACAKRASPARKHRTPGSVIERSRGTHATSVHCMQPATPVAHHRALGLVARSSYPTRARSAARARIGRYSNERPEEHILRWLVRPWLLRADAQTLRTRASACGSCRWLAPAADGYARATDCTCRRSPSASVRPRCRDRSASG